MTHRTLTIAFFVKWNSIRVSLTRANGALLRSFFSSISLSLSLSHTRAHSEITRTRDNRKDRAAIIDEANGYIPRWKVRDARLDWRKIEKDETWDTSGIAKLRERFSVFNERFSLANDAAGVAYIDSSVVGTKRSK